jgi:hypothetical protein
VHQIPEEAAGFRHEPPVVRISPVPFKHGEFRKVQCPSLPFPPAVRQLKDPLIPCGCEPFHAEFRGGLEEATPCGNRVDIGFRSDRRKQKRGIYFEIPLPDKKTSDALDDAGPLCQPCFFCS